MLLLGIFNLGETIADAFFGIMLAIDGVIYGFIDKLYQLFMALASARILSNETIQTLMNRISIVLGVCALFLLAYSLLTAIINPDNMIKDKSGPYNIVKNIVIALVFLALTPALFNFMYKVQDVVLGSNLLGNIILVGADDKNESDEDGESVPFGEITVDTGDGNVNSFTPNTVNTTKSEAVYQNGGRNMAFSMFVPFFRPSDGFNADEIKVAKSNYFLDEGLSGLATLACAGTVVVGVGSMVVTGGVSGTVMGVGIASCGAALIDAGLDWIAKLVDGDMSLTEAYRYAVASGDFGIFSAFASEAVAGKISYSLIVSTIVGLVALYVMFSFCIDLAIRAAKLAYLQMIAPIPILFKVVPKGDKVFSNWIQKVTSTFAEVFIRIIIIFFVVFIISELKFADDFWAGSYIGSPSETVQFFAQAFIILGLLIFAKQAPKLLSEMLGIKSDGLKLGIREKLAEGGIMRGGAALGAGVQTAVRNFNARKGEGFGRRSLSALGGFAGGASRGYSSSKDAKTFSAMKKAQNDAVKKAEAKRDQRMDKSAYLDSLVDENGDKLDPVSARARVFKENMKSWAGIGPSQGKIDAYDRLIKSQEGIDSAVDKIISKYNSTLFYDPTLNEKSFKGDSKEDEKFMWSIYDKYKEYGFSTIEGIIEGRKKVDTSKMSDEDRAKYAHETALYESMLAQLKKKSRNYVESQIKAGNNFGKLNTYEMESVQSAFKEFEAELLQSGMTFTDDKEQAIDYSLRVSAKDAGAAARDIADNAKYKRNKEINDVNRIKRREQAMGKDSK